MLNTNFKFMSHDFLKFSAIGVSALAATLALCFAILAWQSPTAAPPADNADAPINTGSDSQIKAGDLGFKNGTNDPYYIHMDGASFSLKNNSGSERFIVDQDGHVGIGTVSPSQPLDLGMTGRIANVVDPENDQDVVTKKYLHDHLNNLGTCPEPPMLRIKFTPALYGTGDLDGLAGADAKCAAEYPGYHMCNESELNLYGMNGCLSRSDQFMSFTGWVNSAAYNCDNWENGISSIKKGSQLSVSSSGWRMGTDKCSGSIMRSIACCEID